MVFFLPYLSGGVCRAVSLLFRQYHMIPSADTASEVRQMLSQKRR